MNNNILQQYYNFNLQESFRHLENVSQESIKDESKPSINYQDLIIQQILEKYNNNPKGAIIIECTRYKGETPKYYFKDFSAGDDVFLYEGANNKMYIAKTIRLRRIESYGFLDTERNVKKYSLTVETKQLEPYTKKASPDFDYKDYEGWLSQDYEHIFEDKDALKIADFGFTSSFGFECLSIENQKILYRNIMERGVL